ncbi:MAG: glycine dehydrogenase, partial [Verrucomicrobiia bacterium]
LNVRQAHLCAKAIAHIPGYRLKYSAPFFNEFVVACPIPAQSVCEQLLVEGIAAGQPIGQDLLVCVTETKLEADIDRLTNALMRVKR